MTWMILSLLGGLALALYYNHITTELRSLNMEIKNKMSNSQFLDLIEALHKLNNSVERAVDLLERSQSYEVCADPSQINAIQTISLGEIE